MKFLLLGYGSIGTKHAGILRDMGHEVVTVDPDLERGADYQSIKDGIDTLGCNGVLDCTPSDIREGWKAIAVYRFIEKPLGKILGDIPSSAPYEYVMTDSGQTIRISRIAKGVMMGFCYHYLPSLANFVNTLKSQPLAHLLIVGGQNLQDWHAQDYRTRRYDGVVTDSLPHSLYIARWILGNYQLVGSFTGRFSDLEIETEDTAGCLLLSDKNTPCYIEVDYLRAPRLFYIEAITSQGTRHHWEFDPAEAPEMYRLQMDAWVRLCAGENVGKYPDLQDGIEVQKILNEVLA